MSYARLRNSVSFAALIAAVHALAAENTMLAAADQMPSDIFSLGQIETVTITGTPLSQAISESTVNSDEIYRFNALTVDRAIDLTTGATSGTTGGARNERLFFIRGFDRFQSTLMVDGIRVYLPADNRLDVGFFPTATLSQIQVQKGYVSVLSGPGAIGGALNLVTRKPTQPFEYDARAGVALAGNGEYNGYNASLLVGGATDRYYWQANAAIAKTDHWRLSEDLTPTPTEDGGFRDHSNARNYGANVKFGWTPNMTDEYSLSYTGTWGKKNATYSTIDPQNAQKNWQWPYWDVQSVYFLSNTAIGDSAYVQTKLYYNSFRNGLFSYDNMNFNSQTTGKAFRSYYSDHAYGGSIEVGNDFGDRDTLKAAFFYRKDNHTEWQQLYSPVFLEPEQENIEATMSVAAENRLHVTDRIDFVLGASYDWRHLEKAQDFTGANPGQYVNYPLADGNATNVQGAIIYNYSDTGHVHLDVSSRARFPTLFEPGFAEALENRELPLFELGHTVRSPSKYMRGLFDGFSHHYDETMLNKLGYRGHLHVRGLVERVLPRLKPPPWRILDLGCGTGLVGVALKNFAAGSRLDGIDISPRMLEAAHARGIYSSLILGDLETVLAEPGTPYDLIVSADTMTYFGDLAPAFAGVAKRLEPGGFYLFASEAKNGDGWEKTTVHRYRHGQSYIRAEAARAGLEVVDIVECTLRQEEHEPVLGFAVALGKETEP